MQTFGDPLVARKVFDYDNAMHRAPKGFRFIAAGCYRVAYLHIATSLIYKVGDYEANVHESSTSRRLSRRSTRNLPFEIRIPRTRTYRMPSGNRRYPECVVVQEYAESAKETECASVDTWLDEVPPCNCKMTPCNTKVLQTVADWSGLEDIHPGNVLLDKNKVYWLIDMGC